MTIYENEKKGTLMKFDEKFIKISKAGTGIIKIYFVSKKEKSDLKYREEIPTGIILQNIKTGEKIKDRRKIFIIREASEYELTSKSQILHFKPVQKLTLKPNNTMNIEVK